VSGDMQELTKVVRDGPAGWPINRHYVAQLVITQAGLESSRPQLIAT
jgi:hypothetical protein